MTIVGIEEVAETKSFFGKNRGPSLAARAPRGAAQTKSAVPFRPFIIAASFVGLGLLATMTTSAILSTAETKVGEAHFRPLDQSSIDKAWTSALSLIQAEGGDAHGKLVTAGKRIDEWRSLSGSVSVVSPYGGVDEVKVKVS